jgi:mannose-6-phosphate isomerase-like protein (cupin superfamily)
MAQGDPAGQYQAGMTSKAAHCTGLESVQVEPPNATGRSYEVERRACHAARPGFRIVEMQIGPTQTIPWHYHSEARDTFYVLSGSIRVRTRAPQAEVILTPGESCAVPVGCPHSVENFGATSAVFLILQGIGEHDFVPLP